MKRFLCLFAILICATLANAQHTQDFASKFILQNKNDSTLECVTISPKMIGQMVKVQDTSRNGNVMQAVAKLKSARIITANANAEAYYNSAKDLLRRNAKRFQPLSAFKNDNGEGEIYTHTVKDKKVELVMLHRERKSGKLTVVDFTGNIDDAFIKSLAKRLE